MKTLLFIGGTSFFGKLAVRQFLASGRYHVTLLTRGTQIPSDFEGLAAWIRCDRSDAGAMRDALRDARFDVVVDNIAFNGHDVTAALDALRGRVGHYLLCSSAMVYPCWHSGHSWTESEAVLDPIPDQMPYANGKREAERRLLVYPGVPHTIYRPTVVQGPEDPVGRTAYFVDKTRSQQTFFIPDDVQLQHVCAADLADVIVKLCDTPAPNAVFNIAGADLVSLQSYCDRIADLLGVRPCYEVVPRDAFMASHSQSFPPLFDHTLLLSTDRLATHIRRPPTPLAQWLPATITWHRDQRR
ncbi:MAG: NAD-dependent epimerase/dehydratase family protein [Planctomycetota bacterium]|nr:NAD-dependent epimerase/dehydratase family protein [Planctomycetota bacterium]